MLQGGASAFPRSAAGVLALYADQRPDAPAIDRGIEYLVQFKPAANHRISHYFYGHYYAAQAMRQRGGNTWDAWYRAVRDEVVSRQNPAGYWPDSIDNHYGTAMALIILQAPRNYLLVFRDKKP
jgi:hypothetical protein